MARKRRTKQLSVGRILAIKPEKIDKMNSKELRKLTTFLNSAANKRVKRAQQLGTESEILSQAIKGGRFRTSRITKGMTEEKALETAYAEFMRVREFLTKETSTTRGVKKTQRKILLGFKRKAKKFYGVDTSAVGIIPEEQDPFEPSLEDFTEQDLNDLVWTMVDKLAETKALTKENRYQAAGQAYDTLSHKILSKDELHAYLKKWADDNYIQDVEKKAQNEVTDAEVRRNLKRIRQS